MDDRIAELNGEFNAVLNASSWDECIRRIHNLLVPAVQRIALNSRRYEWLRDSGQAVSAWEDLDGVHWSIGGPQRSNVLNSNLDAAIDSAMQPPAPHE